MRSAAIQVEMDEVCFYFSVDMYSPPWINVSSWRSERTVSDVGCFLLFLLLNVS
jgi:hypothetical protein